jgi:hypothetical protein
MSPGVIAIVAFIGMAMIICIPTGIVIWSASRTQKRARSQKDWPAGTDAYYYGGSGPGGHG